jgi:diguanylate cyclase (GGDEF)-like protein
VTRLHDPAADPRETSSATTKLILGYVRDHAGDEGVGAVLERAGIVPNLELLESDSHWVGYDTRIRLMSAAVEVLGDPEAMFKVGSSAVRSSVNPSLVLLLRALGSPSQVFRSLPRAVGKFTTTSTMQMVEVTKTSAVIRYVLHDGYAHSRLDCSYAQGLFSVVPELFGLPPARIVHEECESGGAEACLYHVTWAPRTRLRRRAAGRAAIEAELNALRAQLESLQTAASDLVGSNDLEAVLVRIVEGAASAVLAQGYLLAVEVSGGRTLVHAAGVAPEHREELANALLAGGDLGQPAVVVDVVSTRMRHGKLAVLYPRGQDGVPNEKQMLRAYAGHAAAALDMIRAVDAAQRGQQRADTLLQLSRRLADATSTAEVAHTVAQALPEITECTTAGVMLWDDDAGALRFEELVGFPEPDRRELLGATLTPGDVPELAKMLTSLQPVQLTIDNVGEVLRGLLELLGLTHFIAVPLLAAGELLGVVTVSWASSAPPSVDQADLTMRLMGVGDQASSALQNARLVSAVRHQALHDALTDLPNRVLFTDRLEQALRSRSLRGVGVLFCDLDRFKQVNDGMGHAAGDDLLRQAAARIASAVRDEDSVARLSGDEFAVLLPDVDDTTEAADVARRITAMFDAPFRVEGEEMRVTVSVGVAVHRGPDGRVDELLRSADAAMYDAKQRGLNHVSTSAAVADGRRTPAPSLERELQDAIERDELQLMFQPIVDALTGRAVGAEALVRWPHPRLGLLGPASFLPLAEETQLIVALDAWVMREACRVAAEQQAATGLPLRVAVNLSGRTLAAPDLLSRVRDAVQAANLPAECLELEVVESRALLDVAAVDGRLQALRRLGVRIALDDFGTGYSTLAWLRSLPIDQVKVDRSFTSHVDAEDGTFGLVRGVVALARELGLEVVAEGVETEGQLAALRAAGVHLVQGYLLGRPSPEWATTVAHAPARDDAARPKGLEPLAF